MTSPFEFYCCFNFMLFKTKMQFHIRNIPAKIISKKRKSACVTARRRTARRTCGVLALLSGQTPVKILPSLVLRTRAVIKGKKYMKAKISDSMERIIGIYFDGVGVPCCTQ